MSKFGSERAILVANLINYTAHESGDEFSPKIQDIIPFIKGELQYFRERMRHVIFVSQEIKFAEHIPMTKQNFDRSVVQELSPRTGEHNLTTSRPNAFFESDLLQILASQKVGKLALVGVHTHRHILLTAAAALDHGFQVVVPETCVTCPREQDHQAALRLISKYISYDS